MKIMKTNLERVLEKYKIGEASYPDLPYIDYADYRDWVDYFDAYQDYPY